VSGVCLITRRNLFDEVGGFEETFFISIRRVGRANCGHCG